MIALACHQIALNIVAVSNTFIIRIYYKNIIFSKRYSVFSALISLSIEVNENNSHWRSSPVAKLSKTGVVVRCCVGSSASKTLISGCEYNSAQYIVVVATFLVSAVPTFHFIVAGALQIWQNSLVFLTK